MKNKQKIIFYSCLSLFSICFIMALIILSPYINQFYSRRHQARQAVLQIQKIQNNIKHLKKLKKTINQSPALVRLHFNAQYSFDLSQCTQQLISLLKQNRIQLTSLLPLKKKKSVSIVVKIKGRYQSILDWLHAITDRPPLAWVVSLTLNNTPISDRVNASIELEVDHD